MDRRETNLADDLERPLLVVAFRGLFDASGSATAAVEWLAGRIDHTAIGDVDPETFFDSPRNDLKSTSTSGAPGCWPGHATRCLWPGHLRDSATC